MPSFRNFRNISLYDLSGKQRYIGAEDARKLVAAQSHEWRCVSCGKTQGEGQCLVARNHLMAVFQLESDVYDDAKLTSRPESDTTLTFGDMKRNVGITEGDPGNPEPMMGPVLATRRRITNWADGSIRNAATTVVARTALLHQVKEYASVLKRRSRTSVHLPPGQARKVLNIIAADIAQLDHDMKRSGLLL